MLTYQWLGLYDKFGFVADQQGLSRYTYGLSKWLKSSKLNFRRGLTVEQKDNVAAVLYCRWQNKRNDFQSPKQT